MGRILDYIHRLIDDDGEIEQIRLGTDSYREMIQEFKDESGLSDDDNVNSPIIGGVRLIRDKLLGSDDIEAD